MHSTYYLALAVMLAYAVALTLFPLMRSRPVFLPIAVSMALILLIELVHIVPADQIFLRGLACLFSVDLLLKIVDLLRHERWTLESVTWRDYWHFLVPFPLLLVVYRAKQQRFSETPKVTTELLRFAVMFAIAVTAVLLVLSSHHSTLLQQHFVLDHLLKLALFLVFLESTAQWALALERLAGFDVRPIVDRCFLSRTPGEFWQRYNQRVQNWLYLNIFLPSGGRRKPARAVMVVFLVSAVLHELMFGIATSRFTGYQATFFLLQIPAVLISPRMDRLAVAWGNLGKTVARLLTIAWFVSTTTLFFHGFNQVIPIYYAGEPWLN